MTGTVPGGEGARRNEWWTRQGYLKDRQRTTAVTALSLIVFVLVVGTPLWWSSTEIYRAPLPFTRIKALGDEKTVLPIELWIGPTNQAGLADAVRGELNDTGAIHTGACGVEILYNVSQSARLLHDDDIPDNRRVYGFTFESGDAENDHVHLHKKDAVPTILVGDSRLFRVLQKDDSDVGTTARAIATFVNDVIVDRASLTKVARKASVGKRQSKNLGVGEVMEREMVVPINADYNIDLTLVVADPNTTPATWDVRPAVKRYLEPLFRRLDFLGSFETTSQVLYYMTPGVNPAKASDGQGQVLAHMQLTEFVDNDWPLSSVMGSSLTTPLNFIVYVPPYQEMPLNVLDQRGEKVVSNGFTIPQWGGVHVVNSKTGAAVRDESKKGRQIHQVDMHKSMAIVVTQLRTLLGLPATLSGILEMDSAQAAFDAVAVGQGITLVETDRILRRGLIESMATATSTLFDLSNLLEEVEKMAIRDEIADQVRDCLDSLKQARTDLLSPGRDPYRNAYAHARSALITSETAFFDPTVVKLLYFPDENKYAIYLPLFGPLFATLLMQLKAERAHFRALFSRAEI